MKETASSQIPLSSSWYTYRTPAFYPLLQACACPPRFLHDISIKHHRRGLTLVFGSDGQVSLIGFDSGTTSQPIGIPSAFSAISTGALTSGTRSLSSEATSLFSVPNLEASSASLTGTPSSTLTFTTSSIASSIASSGHDPSPTATDTDTDLPSIPTVDYPTPSPTTVSNPKDHGVGAPFYLAIVLASISFIGCVAALIAWYIRSRARKHDLELHDPWHHADSNSGADSPFTDEVEKTAHRGLEAQTRPYYLPASIVRRSSSNLAVPHTIPTFEDGTSPHGVSHATPVDGRYPSLANDPRHQSSGYQLRSHRKSLPSSQTPSVHSRPDTARVQTGLSVQESTRTLGRLRVANRVPGDVTSGDEGGMNIPRLQTSAGLSAILNTGRPNAARAGENAMQSTELDRSGRPVQESDPPFEPPGPATLPWGRRTDTVAALRRSRRRTPETTVQTYKNARYSGYLYPTLDGGPSSTTLQPPAANNREEDDKVVARPPPDPLGWTDTFKSSFWQAVDAMTGNRPLDSEPRGGNAGSGSRFTAAPRRVASRRPSVSPTTSSSPLDTSTARSQETVTKYELTPSGKSAAMQKPLQDSTYSRFGFGNASIRVNTLDGSRLNEDTARVSRPHLSRDLSASRNRQRLNSLRADTGSVYSTDSAAARANLRKYGYGDSIPSSWSALGESRASQLDLDRTYLPLPRPKPSSIPGSLSITPSQLTLESGVGSSSASVRTLMHSKKGDVASSDASSLRSGEGINTASYVETLTSSLYSLRSGNGTMESGGSTVGLGTVSSQALSTASSMLSRKKGVTTRRKRPRPPVRALSTASSVQSMESGLSIREVAVRRALLERRKKAKATGGLKDREDELRLHGSST